MQGGFPPQPLSGSDRVPGPITLGATGRHPAAGFIQVGQAQHQGEPFRILGKTPVADLVRAESSLRVQERTVDLAPACPICCRQRRFECPLPVRVWSGLLGQPEEPEGSWTILSEPPHITRGKTSPGKPGYSASTSSQVRMLSLLSP